MNIPSTEYVLLRSPRTDESGNKIAVNVSIVKASEADLTNYSFLKSRQQYEEWVPTSELYLYQGVE